MIKICLSTSHLCGIYYIFPPFVGSFLHFVHYYFFIFFKKMQIPRCAVVKHIEAHKCASQIRNKTRRYKSTHICGFQWHVEDK